MKVAYATIVYKKSAAKVLHISLQITDFCKFFYNSLVHVIVRPKAGMPM